MHKAINGCWFQPKKALSLLLMLAAVCLNACSKEEDEQIAEEEAAAVSGLALNKVSFAELEGWKNEDFAALIEVFAKNCRQIMKIKNNLIADSAVLVETSTYQKVCGDFAAQKIKNQTQMRYFIESHFVPYAVVDSGNADGKFTSYYEAEIHAALEPDETYKYPIYGRPNDLIEADLRDFDTDLPSVKLSGRVENGKFVPYFNRAHIENNTIDAPVVLWGDDLVDIHFMQIQGSAVAKLSDGSELRIGYAHNNGRKFKGIGRILLDKGLLQPGEVSMPKIREWLRNNPEQAAQIMAENDRYIFHRISDADGPVGAFGVSLTAGRSLAVDPQYIPLGVPMWLNTQGPDNEKIQKIVFAQDIGGAIKGIVRGDYFWGHGEEALLKAGRMNAVGQYYILLPKAAQ